MKKIFINVFAIILVFSSLFISTSALENDMPQLTPGKKGDLSVEVFSGTKPIKGFEITVYKVADITVQPSGTVLYTLVSPFDSVSVEFDGMNTDSSKKAANDLLKVASLVAGVTKESDETGLATFEDLDAGMYLVCNTKRRSVAAGYTSFKPFLISVPGKSTDDMNNNIWEYSVKAAPKSTLKKIPDSYEPPKTGIK